MADPKIRVEGPYNDQQDSYGPALDIFTVEESRNSAETETNQQSIPGQNDHDTILASLTGQRSVELEGKGSGLRLYQAAYADTPKESLVDWLIQLESLVQSNQGSGFRYIDDVRNLEYDPRVDGRGILFDTVSWTHESGQPLDCEWRLEGQVSEGVQLAEVDSRRGYIDRELGRRSSDITEDSLRTGDGFYNYSLGDVESRSYERSVDINVQEIAYQYDVSNFGLIESGVQGEISIQGKISENEVKTSLDEFSKVITQEYHGEQMVFEDAFTQREFRGSVSSSSTIFESGSPNKMSYRVTLTIGDDVAV